MKDAVLKELTERQQEILDFILFNIKESGYPPSIPEIQKHFSFKSPNAVQDHLFAIERKGYITRQPNISRGIKINIKSENNNDNVVEIPIVGKIAAGTPILAQENLEGMLAVDKSVVKNSKDMFVLRVKGESMINAGIFDGDFAIIHKQSTAEQGEIVVALINDEATLKRFYKNKNSVKLQPENDTMKPIVINPKENDVEIIGKVEGIVRKI